jgi:hypothetical protein
MSSTRSIPIQRVSIFVFLPESPIFELVTSKGRHSYGYLGDSTSVDVESILREDRTIPRIDPSLHDGGPWAVVMERP